MKNKLVIFWFVCSIISLNIGLAFIVNAQSAVSSPTNPNNSSVSGSPQPSTSAGVNNGSIKPEYSNINSPQFRLLICDGPAELIHYNPESRAIEPGYTNKDFIPCDFQGLMMQIQHLINIAMTLAILLAISGLIYAGYLYATGTPANISKAHEIFPSLAKGFIIMLSAWFIVYQILSWLTGTNGYGVLLGL